MANDSMKHRRLQELGESDFEIVEGQPDIRGWDVKTTGGETIGDVDELILDARARKVRYMIVNLDDDKLRLEKSRKVLIPIGMAELDEKDDDVLLQGITNDHLIQLPKYDSDNLTPETERSICSVFGRNNISTDVNQHDAEFYKHEHFNETNLYRRRLLPQSTTAGNALQNNDSTMLRDRTSTTGTEGSNYTTDNNYRNERTYATEDVEDDVLSPVSNNNNNVDRLREDSNDSFERDAERKNRESDADRSSGL